MRQLWWTAPAGEETWAAARTRAALLAVVALAGLTLGTVQWESVADGAGVVIRQGGEIHGPGVSPEELDTAFPEVIGSGACMADFDGDGLDDLYLVSQQYNPENEFTRPWAQHLDTHGRLFNNLGDGTFADVTEQSHAVSRAWGYGCSAADYDGDGHVDLFLANFGPNELFRNEGGGSFENVTIAAGVGMNGACGAFRCMSTNSAWADHDKDGDLDLFVANYVDTYLNDFEHGPAGHMSQPNWLFRNEGDGTFTEVGGDAGVRGRVQEEGGSTSFGVVWFDHDLDGWMDLYVANDQTPNEFYVNRGDGTFEDRSEAAGLDDPRASMGLAVGDYDNDGYPDIFITHFYRQDFGFFRNSHDGTFEDRAGEDDLHNAWDHVGWGAQFVDIERDGDLDIVHVNGHTAVTAPDYAQPAKVYRQDPNPDPGAAAWDRVWVDVSDDSGPGIAEERVSRGAAFGDVDLDGDTDIVVGSNANETARLLRGSGVTDHWLNVRLAQSGMNGFGVGARIILEAGSLAPQHREVQAGASYLSQNTLQQEFGLGPFERADRITVTWPDGGETIVTDVPADRTILIDRATGTYRSEIVAPRTTIELEGVAGVKGWFRSAVTATVSAVDPALPDASGVVETEVALGDADWTLHDGASFVFTEDGEFPLHARSRDAAGNVEPRRTAVVAIDRVPPSASHELAGAAGLEGWWVDEPVTVTLAGEDGGSGVRELRYSVEGGPWRVYREPFLVDKDGVRRVQYVAADLAGNDGPINEFEVRLDRVAPRAAIAEPSPGSVFVGASELLRLPAGPAVIVVPPPVDGSAGTFTVVASALDDVSGVHRVVFVLDGVARHVDRDGPEYTWSWDTASADAGFHRLTVVAVDGAGNLEADTVDVVLVGLGR